MVRWSRLKTPLRMMCCSAGFCGLTACTELPTQEPQSPLDSGIWMLAAAHHQHDGATNDCDPMFLELSVSTNLVTLGRRTFPCSTQSVTFDPVSFERLGQWLSLDGYIVGRWSPHTLEVDLPHIAGHISWDMDRTNEPYRESSPLGDFTARPEWRPDETPVAISRSFRGTEDTPFSGRMHAARLPDAPIEYKFVQSPNAGTMEHFDWTTGEFVFRPLRNFDDVTAFGFTAVSHARESEPATIKIKFTAVPDSPHVNDIYESVLEDQVLVIKPLLSNINLEEQFSTVRLVGPPAHGTVIVDGSSFIYAPDPEYNGPDVFKYRVEAGLLKSNEASVNLWVQAVNDPPTATNLHFEITGESATPLVLQGVDIDSTNLDFAVLQSPQHGQLVGAGSKWVYVPAPGFQQGTDAFTYRVFDLLAWSAPATVTISAKPGPYPCTFLSKDINSGIVPLWRDGSNIYFRAAFGGEPSAIGVAGGPGVGSQLVQNKELNTFGFENNPGEARRTTIFRLGSAVYFTTSTNTRALRFYRAANFVSKQWSEIQAPNNEIASEPSVGDAYVDANAAYLPVSWRTTTSQFVCQTWKIAPLAPAPELVWALAIANGPCPGFWSLGAEQFIFAGSKLMKFSAMAAPPVLVQDLGNAQPTPWMVEAGGKLYFQTRTSLGTETQIDLWATDGTSAGTQRVKQIESTALEMGIFSPVAFGDKLYFAHRKSLWSSDGTEAGTNIVATIPSSSVVGDGAIGTISVLSGRLYFLATSTETGREPWVCDGTTAGTMLLRDIRVGPMGSATASTNPVYFHEAQGRVFFLAQEAAGDAGLWTTDGTAAGTQRVVQRPMSTIVGIVDNHLLYHDDTYFFSMKLP